MVSVSTHVCPPPPYGIHVSCDADSQGPLSEGARLCRRVLCVYDTFSAAPIVPASFPIDIPCRLLYNVGVYIRYLKLGLCCRIGCASDYRFEGKPAVFGFTYACWPSRTCLKSCSLFGCMSHTMPLVACGIVIVTLARWISRRGDGAIICNVVVVNIICKRKVEHATRGHLARSSN